MDINGWELGVALWLWTPPCCSLHGSKEINLKISQNQQDWPKTKDATKHKAYIEFQCNFILCMLHQCSPWFSHGFPMFPHGFPMFHHGFPMFHQHCFTMFLLGCTSGAFGPPGLRNDQEDSLALYVWRTKQKAAPGTSGDAKWHGKSSKCWYMLNVVDIYHRKHIIGI